MNIPLVRGRDFAESDRLDAPPVVIINEWFAKRHWPGEDPLGKRLNLGAADSPSWLTVVGVVKNVVRRAWIAPPEEELYVPYLQDRNYLTSSAVVSAAFASMTLVLRASDDPSTLVPSIRNTVRTLSSTVAVSAVQTMEQIVAKATAEPRFNLFLLSTFAAVALLLAAIGIHGVVSYTVAQRIREIGIRMALGANPGKVVRLIVTQGMSAALAGTAIGWVGAWAMTRLMTSLIYDVPPHDSITFVAVTLVLAVVALGASYFPALRASRIDPVVALKS
jgi:putative ABC transport system permease protein